MTAVVTRGAIASVEDGLRFDANDESKRALFLPGANWRHVLEYPSIKSSGKYSRADLILLAWEILRRMPRYRRQYRQLQDFGIKRDTFHLGVPGSFFTDAKPPSFLNWEDVSLFGHKCIPKKSFPEQTFGEYVAERKDGEAWFVMNRRRWVMDLWGLKYLPNPKLSFGALKKQDLFMPPASALPIVAANLIQPRMVSTYVRQHELLFRLRLDAPLDLQIDAVKMEFLRAQRDASELPRDAMDPLGLPRRKKPRKALNDSELCGEKSVIDLNEKRGRALLKHLELSPIWLRTWDAVQEARIQQIDSFDAKEVKKHQWPRLDRMEIIVTFEQDYLNGLPGNQEGSVYDMLAKSLQPTMVPNWRSRIEKYIEGGDDAFRQLVALAFAKDDLLS